MHHRVRGADTGQTGEPTREEGRTRTARAEPDADRENPPREGGQVCRQPEQHTEL